MDLRAIDKLIATNVMGWTDIKEVPMNGVGGNQLQGVEPGTRPSSFTGAVTYRVVPEYSEKIEKAWEVVEKLRLTYDVKIELLTELVRVDLEDKEGEGPRGIYDETAPLTICIAALKALGVECGEK